MICSLLSTGFEKYSEKERYIKSLQRITELLYFKGCRNFCIPAAPGIPLWAGEIICGMKGYLRINLRIYSPYEAVTAGWPPRERNEFFDMRERADSFILLNAERRDGCFKECETALADVCDVLVLIDGDISSPCDRSVIKYARDNKITLVHEII